MVGKYCSRPVLQSHRACAKLQRGLNSLLSEIGRTGNDWAYSIEIGNLSLAALIDLKYICAHI